MTPVDMGKVGFEVGWYYTATPKNPGYATWDYIVLAPVSSTEVMLTGRYERQGSWLLQDVHKADRTDAGFEMYFTWSRRPLNYHEKLFFVKWNMSR
jgi:hypothetical protein